MKKLLQFALFLSKQTITAFVSAIPKPLSDTYKTLFINAHLCINYEKLALCVSHSYRDSRQGLVQARTLAHCSRK